MNFFLQDPTDSKSTSLQEVLLMACDGAISGGGMFAFATRGGVQFLLEDELFRNFVNRGTFQLIVGVDEVTNLQALNRLGDLALEMPNLSVSAFLHNERGSLFHPKFCWFKFNEGGVLVVGSGNLTRKGLHSNWEAYSVSQLNIEELEEVENLWSKWKGQHTDRLKAINDSDVLTKASLNVWRRRRPESQEVVEMSEQESLIQTMEPLEDHIDWRFDNSNQVLVAEIAGPSRWSQANIHKSHFVNFFGGEPGNKYKRVLLRSVSSSGDLNETEPPRPLVSVASNNYRIELGEASGLSYPNSDLKPIAIFIKISVKDFLYILLMPESEYYTSVLNFLSENSVGGGRVGLMKQIVTSVAELKSNCGDLPFWRITLD